jgi:putative photosynthetic complex assembly protein 2
VTQYLLPALYAVLVWWFSTGVILFLTARSRSWAPVSMTLGTGVLALALAGIAGSADDTSVAAAYCAFTGGLIAWGWQELGFYLGIVAGPRRTACPAGCRGLRHFWHGVETGLWHELTIIATAALIALMTWGQPNRVGLWTFLILWGMRTSAKLNVFFGVRNLNEQFLPAHLGYLRRYFRRRAMNPLFPLSVTVATVIATLLTVAAIQAPPGFATAGLTMLAALTALAVLEHWFLVLPINAEALWQWSVAGRVRNRRPPGEERRAVPAPATT